MKHCIKRLSPWFHDSGHRRESKFQVRRGPICDPPGLLCAPASSMSFSWHDRNRPGLPVVMRQMVAPDTQKGERGLNNENEGELYERTTVRLRGAFQAPCSRSMLSFTRSSRPPPGRPVWWEQPRAGWRPHAAPALRPGRGDCAPAAGPAPAPDPASGHTGDAGDPSADRRIEAGAARDASGAPGDRRGARCVGPGGSAGTKPRHSQT